MKFNTNRFIDKIAPFIVIGVSIAVLAALLIVFFYVLLWGLLIGTILYVFFVIKNKLFRKKEKVVQPERKGRIIEHDDL